MGIQSVLYSCVLVGVLLSLTVVWMSVRAGVSFLWKVGVWCQLYSLVAVFLFLHVFIAYRPSY